jgi:CRISPR/Cas system-associated exonuclease Cas4 (RecB family)
MMVTMSALPRLLNCTASAVLARAEVESAFAQAGNDDHEDLAELENPEHEFAHLLVKGARSEVKLAYDTLARTGRIIGEGGGRDYGPLGPFEIAGSCDVLWVVDVQTGHNDVDPASRNWQLWGYALAAARALGLSKARVIIVYTKTKRIDQHDLDFEDLATFAERLAKLHPRVAELHAIRKRGEQLDTFEGSWCRYCPSKHVCPSKNGLLVQIAERGMAVPGDSDLSTMERRRAAYEQLVRLDQLVSDAKKRLQANVDEHGPIDLGNGMAYGRFAREGDRRIDPAIATKVIRKVVGESAKEFEAVAFERKTSQAAIERACKAIAGQRGLKPKIMEAIEKAGGVKRPIEYPVGEAPIEKFGELPPGLDTDEIDRLLRSA